MDIVLQRAYGMKTPPLRAVVAETVKSAMVAQPEIGTQEKLAKRAGVAQSHISRLLRGQNVTLDVLLEKVADALRVSPALLLINTDQVKLELLAKIFGNPARLTKKPNGFSSCQSHDETPCCIAGCCADSLRNRKRICLGQARRVSARF